MILDSAFRSLQIVLGEAKTTTDCDITACYAATTAAGTFQTFLQHEVSNGTTPVTVLNAPAVGTQYICNEVRLHNNDTVTHTVTLRLLDGTTTRIVYTGVVASSADWSYTPGSGAVVAGVASFNTRSGAVTLLSADVTTALGFTPQSPSAALTLVPPPALITGTTYTVGASDTHLIFNASASCTATLPSAGANSGRVIWLKTIAAFTVVSAASNVRPIGSNTAGTAILNASAGSWAHLVSDGSNWVVMGGA